MLFDIYIYEHGMDLPREGTYYVVASNGIWLCDYSGICQTVKQVDQISFLEEFKPEIDFTVNLKPIPKIITYKVRKFFEEVYKKYASEAVVILKYSPSQDIFAVEVPMQHVKHSFVSYFVDKNSTSELDDSYLTIGTIHSHANFNAFHSSVDVEDELNFDGLHITFGDNDKEEFTISASHCVGKKRKKIDPIDAIEGITRTNNGFMLEDLVCEFDELQTWMNNVVGF